MFKHLRKSAVVINLAFCERANFSIYKTEDLRKQLMLMDKARDEFQGDSNAERDIVIRIMLVMSKIGAELHRRGLI